MYGYLRTVEKDANITSAGTFSPAVLIEGAVKVFAFMGSMTTGTNISVDVGNTATTSQLYPLYVMGVTSGASGIVKLQLPTGASQVICDISQAAGFKYMKFEVSTASTDGGKLKVIMAQ
jgi:guanyl-specific ribonuclease Sa